MGADASAKLAWGINLTTGEYDSLHESVEDVDFHKAIANSAYSDIVDHEAHGYEFDGDMVIIKRTFTWVYDYGISEVELAKLNPPTDDEIAAINGFLDEIGYTGPREIKLLLAAEYS